MREKLEELERRHAVATPGPWEARMDIHCVCGSCEVTENIVCDPPLAERSMEYWSANAEWIAAIHNAFPAILEYVQALDGERETAVDAEAGHWIGIIRNLDPENLCDVFDGKGVEENLRQWLAARDAQQRREGAAEALLELANGRFGDGLFVPDRTHYTAAEISEILTAEAHRIREGK
jgi:hypothetical protein